MHLITSTANPRIKQLNKLTKTANRQAAGLIVIEGSREISLAQAYGWEILEVYHCPELYSGAVPTAPADYQLTTALFAKITYKENPEGIMAVAARRELNLTQLQLSDDSLLIVLEKVEKPGNLGAILRTAYAAGVAAIIVNDQQTDIFHPNVIRASMGHVFSVPIVSADSSTTIDWLRQNNIKIFATATQQNSLPHYQANWQQSSAIVLGTENSGLSKVWLSAADQIVHIPMRPDIDSLNVSVAAGIIAYEAYRQKNKNRQ